MKKRDKWVHIKVTEEERDDWKSKSIDAGMPVSDLIRRRMSTTEVGRRVSSVKADKLRKGDPALVAEVARLGNNLNQVAKWANTYKKSADAVEVISYLVAFDRMMKDLLDKVIKKNISNAH